MIVGNALTNNLTEISQSTFTVLYEGARTAHAHS